jgi:hypothetical protein
MKTTLLTALILAINLTSYGSSIGEGLTTKIKTTNLNGIGMIKVRDCVSTPTIANSLSITAGTGSVEY